jgi:ribonuclease BN (tRNA processing enzyme)
MSNVKSMESCILQNHFVKKWVSFILHNMHDNLQKKKYNSFVYIFYNPCIVICMRWCSIVSVATGYRLDIIKVGVQVPVGSRIFISPCHADWFWGPPNLLLNVYLGLFTQSKETSVWSPSLTSTTNAKIKKTWVSTSTPLTSSWHGA